MIIRSALTLLGVALFAATAPVAIAALGDANEKRWQFDVLLDDKTIGTHTFELQNNGSEVLLETEASFDVKFLFVTAFRYRHQNTEVWNDGCLASIEAVTNSNGKQLEVRGQRQTDGFALADTDGVQTLPPCVRSFAYWNPEILGSEKLLNTQTGDYESVVVTYKGPDQVQVAGEAVDAVRYTISVRGGEITLWYSRDDLTWIGLEAPAKGGRVLKYRAVDVPTADGGPLVVAQGE